MNKDILIKEGAADNVTDGNLLTTNASKNIFLSLGLLDRLLAPLVLVFMIVGCAVGATTGDAVPNAFNQVQFKGVSFRNGFLL